MSTEILVVTNFIKGSFEVHFHSNDLEKNMLIFYFFHRLLDFCLHLEELRWIKLCLWNSRRENMTLKKINSTIFLHKQGTWSAYSVSIETTFY